MKRIVNKKEIIRVFEDKKDKLNEFDVKKIGIFVYGKQNLKSDINFLVDFKGVSYADCFQLEVFLWFHVKIL